MVKKTRKLGFFYYFPILQINIIIHVLLLVLNTFSQCSQNHLEEFPEASVYQGALEGLALP